MGLETGFYNSRPVEEPSMLDSVTKVVNLGQLGVQRSRLALQNKELELQTAKMQREIDDQNAMKAAFSKNIDANGIVNRQGVISDMGRTAPMKSLDVQERFMNFDAKSAEYKRKQLEENISQMGVAANLALSAKDQPSYEKMIQNMNNMGVDTSKLPADFDPGLMRRLAYSSVKQGERLAAQKEQFEEAYKRRMLDQGDRKLTIQENRYKQMGQGQNNNLINKIRAERNGLPTTKATQDVAVAYNKVQQAAKSGTAAGDISLIFGYMKMLDPGSVVREGEYATAKNAAGVPTQIMNMYNKAIDGTFLQPEQRNDFLNQSHKVWQSQLSQQRKVDADYSRIATKNGIDPKDVLLNFNADEPVNNAAERAKQMAGVGGGTVPAQGPQRSTAQAPPVTYAPAPQGMVNMRTPSGKVKVVPQADAQVQAAKGWELITGGIK